MVGSRCRRPPAPTRKAGAADWTAITGRATAWANGRGSSVSDVLMQAALFSALDDDAAAALRASMTEVRLPRGKVIFREGDSGDCLYVITDGKIKLGRTAPDGRENILAVLGPGEMFGELSLFDPEPRTATAIAVVDSTLMSLGHEDLDALLTGRPAVAESMLAALAQRLRRTNESWPISSSATCPVGSPRRCSICRRDSVCSWRRACTSPTT